LVELAGVSHRRVGEFSLGMGQRLGLAVALLGDPPTLVLDEPSNGLDPEGIHWLRQFLRGLAAEGRTVFVSSHLMAEMAVTADHLIVINKGRLLADTSTAEFIKRNAKTVVRIRTKEPEQFRRLLSAAGIAAVLADDGSIEVSGATATEVSRLAIAHQNILDELSTQSASLEEAFLRLTNPTNESAH
jgi:ABC-2 type transport system ATP-binding protein